MVVSCNGAAGGGSTSGDDEAADEASKGDSGTSGMVGTGPVPPSPCESSEACGDDLFCVAPWDAGTGQRGEAACIPACVGTNALDRWCIDDAACCEGLRCNEVDGFCLPLPEATSTGSDTTEGDTSTGTDGEPTGSTSATTDDTSSSTTSTETGETTGDTTTTG